MTNSSPTTAGAVILGFPVSEAMKGPGELTRLSAGATRTTCLKRFGAEVKQLEAAVLAARRAGGSRTDQSISDVRHLSWFADGGDSFDELRYDSWEEYAVGRCAILCALRERFNLKPLPIEAPAAPVEAQTQTYPLVPTDVAGELETGAKALDKLIAVDARRLSSLRALRKLATSRSLLEAAPRNRVAALIAERDESDEKREGYSSAVWFHLGLAAGLHAQNNHGDIVDNPENVAAS